MKIEVFLTGHTVTDEDVKGHTVIVIDVLRTSSTIVTALGNGARDVVPVADMAEGGKIAMNLDQASYRMGGERGGNKIEGYHLGNSPSEYDLDTVRNRTIILNTTNGTGTITNACGGKHLVIGSFLNADRVIEFARETGLDVDIICAGWLNRISLEDTLCAGMMLYHLWDGLEPEDVSDSAHIAFSQYRHDRAALSTAILQSNHAKRLAQQGRSDDVDYCSRVNFLPLLPYYQDSRIVLLPDASPLLVGDENRSESAKLVH